MGSERRSVLKQNKAVLFVNVASYNIGMNNSFNEHIAQICGLELSALVNGYKYSVFSGNTVVVEGHRGICAYSDVEATFFLGDKLLKIVGQNLNIKCLGKSFAVITGQIASVEVIAR